MGFRETVGNIRDRVEEHFPGPDDINRRAEEHAGQAKTAEEFLDYLDRNGFDSLDDLTVRDRKVLGIPLREFVFGQDDTHRYVWDPAHPGDHHKLLDMNHFLASYSKGHLGVALGGAEEFRQWLGGGESGLNPEDFHSNWEGQQFYYKYHDSIKNGEITLRDALVNYLYNDRVQIKSEQVEPTANDEVAESDASKRDDDLIVSPNTAAVVADAASALNKFGYQRDTDGPISLSLGDDVQIAYENQSGLSVFERGDLVLGVMPDGKIQDNLDGATSALPELLQKVSNLETPAQEMENSQEVSDQAISLG